MTNPPVPAGAVIARLVHSSSAHNTLNLPSVEIHIQRCPGQPDGDRGIAGLDYEIRVGSRVAQSGTTGDDGKIEVRIPVGSVPVVAVMGTEYQVRASSADFADVATTTGKKERLRHLGYQLGHDGADGNGVDAVAARYEYERSVLDFQADQGLDLEADPTAIEADLTTEVRG